MAALGLSCGMQTLSCGMHAGSSSPTRGQTRAPCIGSVESYPLDHQGSPGNVLGLERALSYKDVCICQNSAKVHLRFLHFIICKFYMKRKN